MSNIFAHPFFKFSGRHFHGHLLQCFPFHYIVIHLEIVVQLRATQHKIIIPIFYEADTMTYILYYMLQHQGCTSSKRNRLVSDSFNQKPSRLLTGSGTDSNEKNRLRRRITKYLSIFTLYGKILWYLFFIRINIFLRTTSCRIDK